MARPQTRSEHKRRLPSGALVIGCLGIFVPPQASKGSQDSTTEARRTRRIRNFWRFALVSVQAPREAHRFLLRVLRASVVESLLPWLACSLQRTTPDSRYRKCRPMKAGRTTNDEIPVVGPSDEGSNLPAAGLHFSPSFRARRPTFLRRRLKRSRSIRQPRPRPARASPRSHARRPRR
jgi:hypothetical protein